MTWEHVGMPGGAGSTSPVVRPLRLALIVSLVFLAVSLTYIVISGQIAAQASQNVSDLEQFERIKGSIYVATTSLMLFGLCYFLFRGIAKRERELAEFRSGAIAAERRAAAGLFASSVAHDMNNVLTIMDYATKHLTSDQGTVDSETLDDLRSANSDLKKLSMILGRATGHHLGDAETEFDLAKAVRETAELAQTHRKVSFCRFAVETPEVMPFRGIPVMIHQMLLNLIINAADATDRTGTITVKLSPADPGATIEVHDNGPGIADDQRGQIMEPFYTTKDDGSGLGLLSVKVCADAHQGNVKIERSHLGGACFKVRLKPIHTDERGENMAAPSDHEAKPELARAVHG